MTDAVSPFLNLPLRSEREAQLAREQSERERQRRLERHGAAFCRQILDGAYERVDQPDGSYRLRSVATGRWIEEETAVDDSAAQGTSPITDLGQVAVSAPVAMPDDLIAACHVGYRAALRDVAHWISIAAIEPRLHAGTLAAVNAQIANLSDHAAGLIRRDMELG